MSKHETTITAGQVFIRDVGNGLCLVCGIVRKPEGVLVESIYPTKVELYHNAGELRPEASRMSADGVLTSPFWRVSPK